MAIASLVIAVVVIIIAIYAVVLNVRIGRRIKELEDWNAERKKRRGGAKF